jgi:hypothetical protein
MNRLTGTIATSTLLLCFTALPALCEDSHVGHQHHSHDTRGVELGLSAGYAYLDGEDESAPGLHIHLSKRLGQKGIMKHLALGIGGEAIFADHEHYALMLPFSVNAWRGLVLSVAPSIAWAKHEGEWESEYVTHLEASYVFELGEYDMGPVVGYSSSSEEEHYMVGLHFGIHF